MYSFLFSQSLSNSFKTRSFGFFGLVVILVLSFVIGCLAFKARHDQWKVWNLNKNITFFQGSPVFSTADGPYFVHLAKNLDQNQSIVSHTEKRFFPELNKILGDKDKLKTLKEPGVFEVSLLPYIIKSLSKLYNNDYLLASNLLIPISAFLTSIFIFSFFFAMGFGFEGTIAGLGASLSQSLLVRTSIGRVDTDLLNVGFFYSILALIVASFRTNNQKLSLVFISLSGFMNFLFSWWYQHPGFFFPFLITIIILQILHKVKLQNSIFQIILFSLFSGPFFVLKSFTSLSLFISQYLSFNNVNVDNNALIFPDTFQTITELQRPDIIEYFKAVFGQGNEWLGIVGIIGIVFFILFNYKTSIVMLPGFAFLIMSILIGKRFVMYALPIFWFGFAYLCISLSYVLTSYIKPFKTIENQAKVFISSCICICLIILILTVSISSCKNSSFFNCNPKYIPMPSFSGEITKGFRSLQSNNFDQSSIVITWWDYGYWLNYFSGLSSVHDGGSQRSAKTYLVANSLTSSTQKKSYDIMNYIVSSNMKQVLDDSNKGVAFFENRISQSQPINRPVLLILTQDMLGWWSSITHLGNWDIINGNQKDKASFERIDCKPKSQSQMICGDIVFDLDNGTTSNGNQLDNLMIAKNGSLAGNYDYHNKKGKVSMIIDIVGNKRSFYLVSPKTLASTFTQLYFFNLPKNKMFKLVKDSYPFYRVFELYQ